MKLILLASFVVVLLITSCTKDNKARERCWTCDVHVAATGASYSKKYCNDGSYPTNMTDSAGNAQTFTCR